MRFETSQTTPVYLDRRLQLRMLSFVGLIAVIMFTLSAMNLRPRDDSSRQAGVSPDTLNYEVRRDELDLKEGEFVSPLSEDDGPRGQSPRSASRDLELFTSRGKEHTRADSTDDTLFRRRSPTAKNIDNPAFDRNQSSFDPQSMGEELTVPTRPTKGLDRLPPTEVPLAEEDWGTAPVISNEFEPKRRSHNKNFDPVEEIPGGIDGLIPERRIPVAKPVRKYEKSLEPVQENREPFLPDPLENDDRMLSKPESRSNRIDDPVDLEPPIQRKIPNPRGQQPFDPGRGDSFRNENLDPPIDLRRRRDPSRLPAYDNDQAYGEVAPVRIDKRFLDVVKDNTVGIRRDEAEVFYWLLDHARRVPTATLERAGEREVQYINLMTEPDRFRGDPITIEGDLWRLYEFDAGKNQYGVTKIYEGWVFTGDSSNHPYRIVCTNLPQGLELGENLRKPVRITGYFFKREGYRSNGGVHVAPTLLARRISINPMPNGIPLTAGILPYMICAIMAIGMALLVTIVGFAIGDGRSSRANIERLRKQTTASFAGLDVPATESVEETLRQLAELESETAINGAYGPLFSRHAAREHAVHDYATTHQLMADSNQRTHRQQTGVIQSWTSRQQAAQAEIDALSAKQGSLPDHAESVDDELDSDEFEPADNLIVKPKAAAQSLAKPATSRSAKTPSGPSPGSNRSAVTPNPAQKAVTPPSRPTNISYSASKLSEWEEEIASMTQQTAETRTPDALGVQRLEPPANVEREQPASSEVVLDQIRIDPEHFGHDSEMRVEDDVDEDRVAFDRADRDSMSFTLADSTSSVDESTESEEAVNENESTSRWHRFRKRRNR